MVTHRSPLVSSLILSVYEYLVVGNLTPLQTLQSGRGTMQMGGGRGSVGRFG